MRTLGFEFCVESVFPFGDKPDRLVSRASSGLNVFDKPLGSKTVGDNSDYFLAEIIGHIGLIRPILNALNPSRFKGDNGFLLMRDRLKMHGLAVTGHFFCLSRSCHSGLSGIGHSREGGNPEKKHCHCEAEPKQSLHKEIIP